MPRGVYERKPRVKNPNAQPRTRIDNETLMEFVRFTFREDIASVLEGVQYPHQLAVELFYNETGVIIKAITAYHQRGRWMMVNGELTKIQKQK